MQYQELLSGPYMPVKIENKNFQSILEMGLEEALVALYVHLNRCYSTREYMCFNIIVFTKGEPSQV